MRYTEYLVMVTLIPKSRRDQTTSDNVTAILARYTVTALDQHMAGLVACHLGEEEYAGYQALHYEVMK